LWWALSAAALGACGFSEEGACIAPPCPVPLAIEARVTAEDGGPVTGVVARTVGSTNTCQAEVNFAICVVVGYSGTYDLEITADGFEPAHRTVTVAGEPAPRPCACPTVSTAHLDVTLRRASME
jgi:hypothetical protein